MPINLKCPTHGCIGCIAHIHCLYTVNNMCTYCVYTRNLHIQQLYMICSVHLWCLYLHFTSTCRLCTHVSYSVVCTCNVHVLYTYTTCTSTIHLHLEYIPLHLHCTCIVHIQCVYMYYAPKMFLQEHYCTPTITVLLLYTYTMCTRTVQQHCLYMNTCTFLFHLTK